jgi:hypothetical protein
MDLTNCNEYELFYRLYDKVITKEIATFSALKEYADSIIKNPKSWPVLMKIFELIKRLNWGFFAGISKASHFRLWRELVIADEQFPDAGDLKRTISISNLFAAMLDIHGYTKFCQESRKNLSMLHALDQVITNDIQMIATQCQSISRREQGDEIVLIAASATDIITATLSIIDYFARSKEVRDPAIKINRSKYAEVLPVLKISAGISGGNTSIPLIITDDGDFSGSLLNTAARLQARANELSPRESRIMITKQIQLNADAENKYAPRPLFQSNTLYFFDTGFIEFKGVLLPTCELIYKSDEMYKAHFSEEMQQLYTSIKAAQWEQKIYTDLIKVLMKATALMRTFCVPIPDSAEGTISIDNNSFKLLCNRALNAYVQDDNYPHALELLQQCISVMESVPDFDRLILDYAQGILDRYSYLLQVYEDTLNLYIDENLISLLNEQQLKTFSAARKGAVVFEKTRAAIRKSPQLIQKKPLWYKLIKQRREKMTLTIYSGKK